MGGGAKKQKDALNFVLTQILAEDAFYFDPDLLNKLAPERYSTMRRWGGSNLDLSIHKMINQIQKTALYKIFNPTILQRIQDNEIRMGDDKNKFTLNELFVTMSTIIWKAFVLRNYLFRQEHF